MRAPVIAALLLLLSGCSNGSGGASDEGAEQRFGVITGVVVDEAVRPMPDVLVRLDGANLTTATDVKGEFRFEGLAAGAYFVEASKATFMTARAQVSASGPETPVTKITLVAIPSQQPFVEALSLSGYLSLGASLGATSVGSTTFETTAGVFGDQSVWTVQFTQLPQWAQAELVWEHTQAGGGQFVWEMTNTSNQAAGYGETASSPALAYWNTTVLRENSQTTLDPQAGIAYRFFGGPHPAANPPCLAPPPAESADPCQYGFGLTVQQKAEAFLHTFYNCVPSPGWRFTVDGPPDPARS